MLASTPRCSITYVRFVQQEQTRLRRSPAKCENSESTISSPKAAKFGPMAGSFTTCILSRSRHPKNRAARGTTTKYFQLSAATKLSDRSAKANAPSSRHSRGQDHDAHFRPSPTGHAECDPSRLPFRCRISAIDRVRSHYRVCHCGERGRAVYIRQIRDWIYPDRLLEGS